MHSSRPSKQAGSLAYEEGLDPLGYALRNARDYPIRTLPAPDLVKERILVGAEGLPLHVHADIAEGQPRADYPASRIIYIPGDDLQDGEGTAVLRPVGSLILGAGALVDARASGLAKSLASLRMSSAGTQVICCAHSGVNL